MRARIDISELEAETKIRAKYLRALENEEWDLLPGPTYVKSFLREYADALGLDGKLLVAEYKLRNEGPSDFEMQPISPRTARQRQRERQRGRATSGAMRDVLVAVVVLLVIGGLILIGRVGGSDSGDSGGPAVTTTAKKSKTTAKKQAAKPKPAPPKKVRLTLVATGPVYICLRAGQKVLVPGRTLAVGQTIGPYKAKRFAMTFGNSNLTMRVNGKKLTVPPSSGATGYAVDRKGRHTLTGRLPTCGV